MRNSLRSGLLLKGGGVGTVGLDVFVWGCFMVVLFRVGTWDLEMW